jgi:hypothetical protein
MFYVNNRWLGGMLTNFATIKKSLLRLKKLEKMEVDGTFENLTKKEIAALSKERAKLQKNLGGIKEMKDPPGILFIIDTRKEAIAVAEAQRMGIPIVAVVDTNCNPEASPTRSPATTTPSAPSRSSPRSSPTRRRSRQRSRPEDHRDPRRRGGRNGGGRHRRFRPGRGSGNRYRVVHRHRTGRRHSARRSEEDTLPVDVDRVYESK